MKRVLVLLTAILLLAGCSPSTEENATPARDVSVESELTGNVFLDANFEEVLAESGQRYGYCSVSTDDAKSASIDDFCAFVDERVRDSGLDWITIKLDSDTGIVFIGSDPANVAYGLIAHSDHSLSEQYGVIIPNEDGTYAYVSFLEDGLDSDNEALSTEEKVDDPDDANSLSLDDMVVLIEIALNDGYENYTVSCSEDNLITIDIWQDNLAYAVLAVQSGELDPSSWDNVKDSQLALSDSIRGFMDSLGFEDVHLLINVLNDLDKDKTLLSIYDSVIIADALG